MLIKEWQVKYNETVIYKSYTWIPDDRVESKHYWISLNNKIRLGLWEYMIVGDVPNIMIEVI